MYNQGMAHLTLRNRLDVITGIVLLDDEDLPLVEGIKWYANNRSDARTKYAQQSQYRGGQYMHRLIMGLAKGDKRQCDHINGIGLDNRRANLRIVSVAENRHNIISHRGSSSQYRGVYWEPERKRWRAQVRLNGRTYRAGRHRTELAAAEAALALRKELLPLATDSLTR